MSKEIGEIEADNSSNSNKIYVTQCSLGTQITIDDKYVYLDKEKAIQLSILIMESLK